MYKISRKILAFLGFISVVVSLHAQPRFTPDNPAQRVGEVIFQNPKTIRFSFQNNGNKPLVISEVHPSCGCIEASWPKNVIPAGGKGTILATYDAKIMGTFYKELLVYTNVSDDPIYLSFEGRVVSTPLDFASDFPVDLGSLRLNTNYLEFDNVNKGDKPQVELEVANMERGAYKPELMHLPHYLTAEYIPEVIQGGRVGKIRLTLDSKQLYADGLNQSEIYLARYPGDRISSSNEILVSSVLLPTYVSRTAAQMKTAPQMVLSEDWLDIDFGGKKKVTRTINVTNIGEETLTISKVQVFNQAVTVSLGNRTVAPHMTTKLKVSISAQDLKNAKKNAPRVLIISNDPRHGKTILPINVKQ